MLSKHDFILRGTDFVEKYITTFLSSFQVYLPTVFARVFVGSR